MLKTTSMGSLTVRVAAFAAAVLIAAAAGSLAAAPDTAYAADLSLTTSSTTVGAPASPCYSDYAIIESDGILYPCNANGTHLQVGWGDDAAAAEQGIAQIDHLLIAADVAKVEPPNYCTNNGEWERVIGENNADVDSMSDITFLLDSQGKSHVTALKDFTGVGAFQWSGNLTQVKNFDKTQIVTIPPYAFKDCPRLASIKLPNTCKEIGNNAFRGCTQLASVKLGSKLNAINDSAFADCASLASIDLPASLNTIGRSAFAGCESLKKIVLRNTAPVEIEAYFGTKHVLKDTPFAAGDSSARIYVPNNLVDKYTADSSANSWNPFASSIYPFYGHKSITLTYAGKPLTPGVTLSYLGERIDPSNYTLTYANNKNVGTATITIAFKNAFSGTSKMTFKIVAAKGSITATAKAAKKAAAVKAGKALAAKKYVKITKKTGTVTYKLAKAPSKVKKHIKVAAKTGKITVAKGCPKGTYTLKVKLTAKATKNYKSASKTIAVKVKVR